eukprot:SM000202S05906  [mRNA]  locus=s202:223189:227174:- [translate_table: standard]
MAPSPGPALAAALAAALAGLLLLALRGPAAAPPPDLLFFNATFWTADPAAPLAAALAVRAGRIQALGSRAALAALAGPQTRKVDLHGRFVAPGFVDAHLHFLGGGLELVKLDLRNVGGRDDLAAVISAAAAGADSGAWIQGWGWNHDFWGALPSASWVDPVSPNNPVWLTRIDGHMGLANKLALERANISMLTPDPPGGSIVRDLSGSPSGLLQETAMQLVTRNLPATSLANRRAALARACKHALSHGVTAIHDFGNFLPGSAAKAPWDDLNEVYLHGDMTGDLLVRAYVFVPLETWPRLASRVAERGFWASDQLRWGGVKAFADGSIGSRTALFHEPYLDVEGTAGIEVVTKKWLLEHALGADKATLQVAVHAIGDRAVDNVLDVFEEVSTINSARDRRLRVEHAQHLSSKAAPRFGALKAIASMQLQHLVDDAPLLTAKLGHERAYGGSYIIKSLLGSGSNVALGSDWTVAPLEPLQGIHAAANRIPKNSQQPFNPLEILSVHEALLGYTKSAAFAGFAELQYGQLAPGLYADFVVLSGVMQYPNGSLDANSARVVQTYVGGDCRHGC